MTGERLRPDIADVRKRWEAFWRFESPRPMVWAWCPKQGEEYTQRIPQISPRYPLRPTDDPEQVARNVLELRTTCQEYVADEVPAFDISFGPDQMSGFLGQTIEYSEHSAGTSWSKAIEGDLESLLPMLQVNENNSFYARMLEFQQVFARVFDGRVVIGGLDYHSNFDCIASMRDPVNACIDLIEKPELMKEALGRVNDAFKRFYNRFYDVAKMAEVGTCSWLGAYSAGRYQTLNSDFICMLSPEQVDEFVIPCLEEECSVVDHAIFHLDGVDAIKHVPSIAAIDKVRVIQWTPTSGLPGNGPHWLELYRDILKTGKGIYISSSVETAKLLHNELKSNKIVYNVGGTRADIEDFVRWLERN